MEFKTYLKPTKMEIDRDFKFTFSREESHWNSFQVFSEELGLKRLRNNTN